ncbi:MAG: hypothetical protein K8U03_08090 [Planctomycetia bacterium]|nr:hypothetical protein [Planctomycetia bacterium]
MLRFTRVVLASALVAAGATSAKTADFHGWQGMRVIPTEGSPERIRAADLNGDGKQELIVVNTRQSRLDLYRRLEANERKPVPPADPDRPNELPLAPDWSHTEVPLDDLPADVVAADVEGDKKPELLIVTGPALKLSVFKQEADGKWRSSRHWDLLTGQLAGRGNLLLVRTVAEGKREVLVSCEQGIQVVSLEGAGRAAWFHPRETSQRVDWRLADLDGDGDHDLLEWTVKANQTVRWYECAAGALRPPQMLYDQSAQQVGCLAGGNGPTEVLCLGGAQSGLLRRYQMAKGEDSPWGLRATLPIAGMPAASWCGIKLDGALALAAVDPTEPKIRTYRIVDDQWSNEESYPTIGNVREIAAPAGRPGTLLMWVKDANDLYESRWEKGRLTYPKPMTQSADVADRRITALEAVGDTVWWAQRVGDHLDLYVWPAAAKEPEKTRFEKAGTKVERVLWLGGKRVLVQQAYSTAGKIVALENNKTVVKESGNLAKVNLAEYRLYPDAGRLRLGRLTEGVLQWLDDSLQPLDQVMLPDGQKLAGYVPVADGESLGLETGGRFLHRLKFDSSGIARTTRSEKLPGGIALRNDPVLGLFLVDGDRLLRLTAGRPWELKLIDTIDGRKGRPSGVKEAVIHRFIATDLTGDGVDEAILCDDRRHQFTALERRDGELRDLVSWQVFEDQAYPYGEERSSVPVGEPRTAIGFNADGDKFTDMALLSQDRLVIYLGREDKP